MDLLLSWMHQIIIKLRLQRCWWKLELIHSWEIVMWDQFPGLSFPFHDCREKQQEIGQEKMVILILKDFWRNMREILKDWKVWDFFQFLSHYKYLMIVMNVDQVHDAIQALFSDYLQERMQQEKVEWICFYWIFFVKLVQACKEGVLEGVVEVIEEGVVYFPMPKVQIGDFSFVWRNFIILENWWQLTIQKPLHLDFFSKSRRYSR